MSLNAKQLEALKAGASMEEVLAMAASPEDLEAAKVAAEAAKGLPAGGAPEAKAGEGENPAPTVESLQASLTAAEASLETANAEKATLVAQLAEANEKLKTAEADHKAATAASEALATAIKPYALRMSVALGKSDADVKDLNGVALAEAHAKLADDFSKTFPSGRKSGSTTDTEAKATAQKETAFLAQAKSINF